MTNHPVTTACDHRRQRIVEHSGVRVQRCETCDKVLDVRAKEATDAMDQADGITASP
jgi:hypothetical protein